MADVEKCCNLRCCAYAVAILTIIGGILEFFGLGVVNIIGGIITVALGCLLLFGIRKERADWILWFIIAETVLWIIFIIASIVGIVNHSGERATFGGNIGGAIIGLILLVIVYLYYRQLKRGDTQVV